MLLGLTLLSSVSSVDGKLIDRCDVSSDSVSVESNPEQYQAFTRDGTKTPRLFSSSLSTVMEMLSSVTSIDGKKCSRGSQQGYLSPLLSGKIGLGVLAPSSIKLELSECFRPEYVYVDRAPRHLWDQTISAGLLPVSLGIKHGGHSVLSQAAGHLEPAISRTIPVRPHSMHDAHPSIDVSDAESLDSMHASTSIMPSKYQYRVDQEERDVPLCVLSLLSLGFSSDGEISFND